MTGPGVYEATLINRKSGTQRKEFSRLSDAINWLSAEFDAGDGYFVSGEILQEGKLLWRRGAPVKPE